MRFPRISITPDSGPNLLVPFCISLSVCHFNHNCSSLIKPTTTHKVKCSIKIKTFYGPTLFGAVHMPASGTTLKTCM
jgi:hypothetical protein